ncbi:hypothetical protein OKW34_003028 [Paraburkholderia youngii]
MRSWWGRNITPIPDTHIISAIPGAAGMQAEVMRQGDQQRAALRDLFDAAWRHADVAGQFRCGDASDMCSIVRYARLADHIIAGQSNPNAPETYIHDHVGEQLMMIAGRPPPFTTPCRFPRATGHPRDGARTGGRAAWRAHPGHGHSTYARPSRRGHRRARTRGRHRRARGKQVAVGPRRLRAAT